MLIKSVDLNKVPRPQKFDVIYRCTKLKNETWGTVHLALIRSRYFDIFWCRTLRTRIPHGAPWSMVWGFLNSRLDAPGIIVIMLCTGTQTIRNMFIHIKDCYTHKNSLNQLKIWKFPHSVWKYKSGFYLIFS